LLAHLLGYPRLGLYTHGDEVLGEDALAQMRALLRKRADGVPVAYPTGTREFYGVEFAITPDVLVPRPETELLVEHALREIPRAAQWQILDLGTGSGAIAVAIASERPGCEITAVDASADALLIAQQNVRHLDLPNVNCLQGDWTAPVAGRTFDVIVSNPPYVADGDAALETLKAEPSMALVSGGDGLDSIRRLARDCQSIIANDGLLILEHGNDQPAAVAEILANNSWRDIACVDDYAGNPRMTSARPKASKNDHN